MIRPSRPTDTCGTWPSEAGITYRNYGEFLEPDSARPGHYTTGKPYLASHSHPTFPAFDMKIPDQRRADLWLEDFKGFAERGDLPALETIWLPRDHTAGGRAGFNTPRAMAADNDYAVGRIVDARLSLALLAVDGDLRPPG